mgnify:CR=1 FL=1
MDFIPGRQGTVIWEDGSTVKRVGWAQKLTLMGVLSTRGCIRKVCLMEKENSILYVNLRFRKVSLKMAKSMVITP